MSKYKSVPLLVGHTDDAVVSNLTAIVDEDGNLVEILHKRPSGEVRPLLHDEWVIGMNRRKSTSPLTMRVSKRFTDEEVEHLYGYNAIIPPIA